MRSGPAGYIAFLVLTCTVGDLLVKQSQDHPVHIPRLRVQTMREVVPCLQMDG
jgi:hypothetical protein